MTGPSASIGAAWLRRALRPPALQYPGFRVLWLGSFFNSIGFMGEQVVLGWLVLEITGSVLMVGVAFALRMVPALLFGVLAGAIADRFDRRKLIPGLSLGMALGVSAVGLLVLIEAIQLWHLLFFAFLMGNLTALYQTTQQSFAYDIVGPTHVISGLSLVALSMRTGGALGALTVGIFIDLIGTAAAYGVLAVGYVLATLTFLRVRISGQAAPAERHPVWQNVTEYLHVALRNRTLLMLIALTGAVEVFGFSHQTLLPSLARDILHVSAAGLGVMNAFRSLGGILAIIALSALGEVHRKGLTLLIVHVLFGAALMLLGLAPSLPLALVVLVLVSGMAMLSDILSQSLVQLAVPNEQRGRAMGSWILATGTAPLGHFQIGALAAGMGVGLALAVNGLGLMALALAMLAFSPRLRRL